LARSRGIIAHNLPLLDGFFARMEAHFTWVRPRAASVAFPRLRHGDAAELDAFAAGLVDAKGVLLLPGSQFGYPGSHFRLGFGRLDMPEALEGLEAFATKVFA
jgi:aspartate/methionine/tyrosine aminotransferase